jgi:hypothetical protein
MIASSIFFPKLPSSAHESGYYAWLERFRIVREHPTLARTLYVRVGVIPYLHDHLRVSYSTAAGLSAAVLLLALLGMLWLIALLTGKPQESTPARVTLDPVWVSQNTWATAEPSTPTEPPGPSRRERLSALSHRARQLVSRASRAAGDAVPLL